MDERTQSERGRDVARNTLLLYGRMLVLLFIGLYTSRVILKALGVDDLGIYTTVGDVTAMFAILSGSLSAAISRFLTYELGTGHRERLQQIFSSAVSIQIFIALVIALLAEPVGLWFIGHKMTIEPDRIAAARWVLHFSVITFAINLISVPYNAAIIAHEHMGAFAWIGIMEGAAKLAIALLILHAGGDRLILYSALMCIVALLVRLIYGAYCHKKLDECRFSFHLDWKLLGQMFSFAGWNFIGSSAGVIRDRGGNILINLFSGTAVNGARGLALQLSGAVQGFANNFMTAINPQITKSYAGGERDFMLKLVFRGARFAFYLLLLIGLPVLMNTGFLLKIWLGDVPEHTLLFTQLALIFAMSEAISGPLITTMLATGDIRDYQIIVGGIQLLNIPLSWIFLRMGYPPETVLVVAIVLSQVSLGARLILLKRMIDFPVRRYIIEVWARIILVAAIATVLPRLAGLWLPQGWLGFIASCIICVLWSLLTIWALGLDRTERAGFIRKFHRV